MPIHLFWGDDSAARDRAVASLIEASIDPTWSSVNLSRLDGSETGQAEQALEEARTPPFGAGMRVVLLQRSPFCNACKSIFLIFSPEFNILKINLSPSSPYLPNKVSERSNDGVSMG